MAWMLVGDTLPEAVRALEQVPAKMRSRFGSVLELTGSTRTSIRGRKFGSAA